MTGSSTEPPTPVPYDVLLSTVLRTQPVGIEFAQNVGRLVGRHVDAVEEATRPGIGEIDLEAVDRGRDIARRGEDRGSLHGDAEPKRLVKVPHEPDLPVARVVEADDVEVVDRQRRVLLSRNDPDLVLGQQAPGLTGQEM